MKGLELLTELRSFVIDGCVNLTAVDFSHNTHLTGVAASNAPALTTITFASDTYTGLTSLVAQNSGLTSLTIPNAPRLRDLRVVDNALTTLNFQGTEYPALLILDCSSNRLADITVKAPSLSRFNASGNQIEKTSNEAYIDNRSLRHVSLGANNLSQFNVENSALTLRNIAEEIQNSKATLTKLAITNGSDLTEDQFVLDGFTALNELNATGIGLANPHTQHSRS